MLPHPTSSTPPLTGAVLAGGFSRRLGQDKALLKMAGKPLALWAAEALAPLASPCWLVTNHPQAHLALGLPLITDLRPFQGPLGGILTALFYALTPYVLITAVDSPFPAPAILRALVAESCRGRQTAVVCRSARGLEPFPGVYAVRLLPQLTEFLKTDRRVIRFLESCRLRELPPDRVAELDPDGRTFANLNTPAEVARAAAWLRI